MEKINKFMANLSSWFGVISFSGVSLSALSTYISVETQFLNALGNFKYVIIFSIFCLLYSLCIYLVAKSKKNFSETKLNERFSEQSHHINILDEKFDRKVIKFSELYMSHRCVIENKIFTHCRFVGPIDFYCIDKVNLDKPKFLNCNFIDMTGKQGVILYGTIGFKHCHFINCEFDFCTLFAFKNLLSQLPLTEDQII